MKRAFIAALFTFIPFSLIQAAVVETNVVIQFKVYTQGDTIPKGDIDSKAIIVQTVKTADIIQAIARRDNQEFSKSARLMYQIFYSEGALVGERYIIRDKSVDYDVNSLFVTEFIQVAEKSRMSKSKRTGTRSGIAAIKQDIFLNQEAAPSQGFTLTGLQSQNSRIIKSPQSANNIISVDTFNLTLTGKSVEIDGETTTAGVAAGSMKFIGPKVLPYNLL